MKAVTHSSATRPDFNLHFIDIWSKEFLCQLLLTIQPRGRHSFPQSFCSTALILTVHVWKGIHGSGMLLKKHLTNAYILLDTIKGKSGDEMLLSTRFRCVKQVSIEHLSSCFQEQLLEMMALCTEALNALLLPHTLPSKALITASVYQPLRRRLCI